MGSMRTFVGVFAGATAVLVGFACASFREGEGDGAPPPAPGADAAIGSDADGATSADAGSCRGGRDAGNACGAEICGAGETCCLEKPPHCTDVGSCPTTQVNCGSPNECPFGRVCCQVAGDTTGTECQTTCEFGVPLCEKDSDCKAGEYCRPPDPSQRIAHFHCAACPGQ